MSHLNLARRVATACLVVATTPFISVGPAHAAELSWTDAKSDMWRMDMMGDTEGYSAAPRHAIADLRRVTVRHTDRAVVVRARFVELKRAGMGVAVGGTIRTDAGLKRDFSLWADPQHWAGTTELAGRRGPVSCDVAGKIDYTADTATVTVPRTCVKNPRWVKLQVGAVHLAGTKQPVLVVDDGHTAGTDLKSWTGRVRRG